MTRIHALVVTPLLATAICCAPAYADRIATGSPDVVLETPHAHTPSPYRVELVAANGSTLPTFRHRGRFYVLGDAGDRYSIRVTNPTNRRVEAVISVDGLDVIDGRTASYHRRGYIVPAYGHVQVDGFRVSLSQVAAFRFSSVADSYAGRKRQARNVGVIGVAIFAEKSRPVIVRPPIERWHHRYGIDRPAPRPYPHASARPVPRRGAGRAPAAAKAPATAGARPAAPAARSELDGRVYGHCCTERPQTRPGLGTRFGEHRYSAVGFTHFRRANPSHPTAVAVLRYNDASGLRALGIRIPPAVPASEIMTRETANPFPASFSEPPPR